MLKLFLAERIAPTHAARLLRDQYTACQHRCDELAHYLVTDRAPVTCEDAIPEPFARLVTQVRLAQLQAFMRWLAEATDRRDRHMPGGPP